MTSLRLQGRVAIVTGGASSIGAASARLLAAAGAAVVVADINFAGAAQVRDEILAQGNMAEAFAVDIAEEPQIAAMIGQAEKSFGRLDILFNNAALTGAVLNLDADITALDADVWDRTMTVNAGSVMLGCKYAIPALRAAGGGSIINTASAAGGLGDYARTAYGASKAAIMAVSRYVATQHGNAGIRCNTIVPGLVMTPSADEYLSEDAKRMLKAAMLTPWFGTPEDIAELVLFLASDQSRYITGQDIWIDGGASARSQNAAIQSIWPGP